MLAWNPEVLSRAAQGLSRLGVSISDGNAVADAPTTAIPAVGADEVSAAVASVLNEHGQTYQSLAARAEAFHSRFVATLASSVSYYQTTEADNANSLRGGITVAEQPYSTTVKTSSVTPIPSTADPITLVVSGTGYTTVSSATLNKIGRVYFPGTPSPYALYTPEEFWPFTPRLGSLTLDQSAAVGTQNLNSAILTQVGLGHTVNVWGTSQGSLVTTDEIRWLMADGSPGTGQVKFILTGDPGNPDGGVFARFTGPTIPGLGVRFNGATPPDSPYQTAIYTNQYDGVADFPRYPLNVVADANAIAGFDLGRHDYVDYSLETHAAQPLPTSPGYTGKTTYYIILNQNLPLLNRYDLPQPYGAAIADLIQPDLRVLIDMGYGSGEYANIPTRASLLEFPNWPVIGADLLRGVVQGSEGALVDLHLLPGSYYPMGRYPFSPVLDPGLNYPLPQTGLFG
ncbi:PE-PPE domain-containing protein [Mycobacterium sp.]|uniref:PE family protein n=1 Tax=Mycobacterium sp. TaxID=1785 RepID=UPI0025D56E1C|nr:PE-PPE domain-containing protein [Mycobacterium sp.]